MSIFKKENMVDTSELINENAKLLKENSMLRDKLEAIQHMTENTPVDCTPGAWCRACTFAKVYNVPHSYFGGCQAIYICGKGKSCRNFLQRDYENNMEVQCV